MTLDQGTLLLLDDDSEFCADVQKVAEAENISLQVVGTVSEAKAIIEIDTFVGFLVDHTLPDGEGVDFISYLRKNEQYLEVPVALVTAHRLESPLFQKMRSELSIKFAFEKPLEVEELKQLLLNLAEKQESVKQVDALIEDLEGDDFLEDLKKEYEASIPEKISGVKDLIEKIVKEFSSENIETLKKELHKIAGSAGSYGHMEVSRFCKKMETSLEEDLKNIEQYKDNQDWIESLWFFFNNMKIAFEKPLPKTEKKRVEKRATLGGSGTHIYVIDDDSDLLKLIIQTAKDRNLNVETSSTVQEGLEKLQDSSFQPKIILVDKNFTEEGKSGYDFIEEFRRLKGQDFVSILGMFTGEGTVEQRVHATSLGVELFFQKPIQMDELFNNIEEVLEGQVTDEIRVMHIDDDEAFCDFTKGALKEIDIDVLTYLDGVDFFQKLEEGKPNVLLLDIEMPKFSGLTLLELARADFRFRNLPVILLTSREDQEAIQKGYSLGVEDYIQKPVTKDMLQVRMLNFLRKHLALTSHGERDELTGLYNQSAVSAIFHTITAQEKAMCLVGLIISCDETVSAVAIKEIATFLSTHFRSRDIMGRWEQNRFVIIFPGFKATQMPYLMGKFFDDIRDLSSLKADQKLVLNAGVTSYPDNGDILGNLVQHAFEKAEEAKAEGPWTTHCAEIDKDFTYMESKGKRVLVVDDDEDIIKMVQYAFQMRGFDVIALKEGEPTIRWLKEHIIKDPPHMIVLDCNLPDISGMIILDKIKEMAGSSIPVLMLSSLSQEQNILEALRKGAQEYVTKPFSMNILMEKTLHLLSK
ncbi:MAG: Regulator of RpoS [Chlamydiia bacterium]|nr:Regulator of RpoS [Chlamydiia bacterium]MCH9615724.1 Regulator of RpoS [Chlamydiia bacterium]MCH9628873.1 Regulator of RpoS [Chlamydiia bacterium]